MPIVRCENCGTEFHKFQSYIVKTKHHYCSPSCVGAILGKKKSEQAKLRYEANPKLCSYCKEPLEYEKRENKFCDLQCSHKAKIKGIRSEFDYVQLCGLHGHPMADSYGRILEHRLIMSLFLNRFLSTKEVVHHINGNKRDNRIENLQLVSSAEHAKQHPQEITWVNLKCSFCGADIKRRMSSIKKNQLDFFCNRSCKGSDFQDKRRRGFYEQ